jgi:hypothetical protein
MKTPESKSADGAREQSDDYEVGYKRPPVHIRFKPGRSGNPKSRPKGRKNMGTLTEDILSERIPIREGDKVRKVSKAEVLVRALY